MILSPAALPIGVFFRCIFPVAGAVSALGSATGRTIGVGSSGGGLTGPPAGT